MDKDVALVNDVLATFSRSLSGITTALPRVLAHVPSLDASVEATPPLLSAAQKARVYVTLAYAANVLFYMYLRTQGVEPKGHPVCDEIVRVYETWNRLKQVELGKGEANRGKTKGKKGPRRGSEGLVGLDVAIKELDAALAGREVRKGGAKVARRMIFGALGVVERDHKAEGTEGRDLDRGGKEAVCARAWEIEDIEQRNKGNSPDEDERTRGKRKSNGKMREHLQGVLRGRVNKEKKKNKKAKKIKKSGKTT